MRDNVGVKLHFMIPNHDADHNNNNNNSNNNKISQSNNNNNNNTTITTMKTDDINSDAMMTNHMNHDTNNNKDAIIQQQQQHTTTTTTAKIFHINVQDCIAARMGLPLHHSSNQSLPLLNKPVPGDYQYSGLHDTGPLVPPKEGVDEIDDHTTKYSNWTQLIAAIQQAKVCSDTYLTQIIEQEAASAAVSTKTTTTATTNHSSSKEPKKKKTKSEER